MKTTTKSYIENGNLTRGQYGECPHPIPVIWDCENQQWEKDILD